MTQIAGTIMGAMTAGSDPWAGMRQAGGAVPSGGGASTLWTALQGGATLFSVFADLSARRQQNAALEASAGDAEGEIAIERLQGLERRASLKQAAFAAVSEANTAYAASGLDLTFGSPVKARGDAYRELDTAMATDANTEATRIARLKERAATYRARAKTGGGAGAAGSLFQFAADVAKRG